MAYWKFIFSLLVADWLIELTQRILTNQSKLDVISANQERIKTRHDLEYACFPALFTGCMFSRAQSALHVFPRLELGESFRFWFHNTVTIKLLVFRFHAVKGGLVSTSLIQRLRAR